MTDKFSFRRLLMLAKREFISKKRLFIMEMAVVAGLILLAEFLISWAMYPSLDSVGSDSPIYSYRAHTCVGVLLIMGLIGFTFLSNIAASLVCSDLSNKKGRINNFMAVGTPLEKYLLNFLIYNVIFVIYYFVAWAVVDCLRMVIVTTLYPFGAESVFSVLFKSKWELIVGGISLWLFFQAFYTLVSAFSPKLAFLKAFGLSYVFNFLAIPYSLMFSFLYINVAPQLEYAVIVASGLALIFTIAMQWLAYFRYTETDII